MGADSGSAAETRAETALGTPAPGVRRERRVGVCAAAAAAAGGDGRGAVTVTSEVPGASAVKSAALSSMVPSTGSSMSGSSSMVPLGSVAACVA